MPLLPVHQCGQAQLFSVMRKLVIFHQVQHVCGKCTHTKPAMWRSCYKLRRNNSTGSRSGLISRSSLVLFAPQSDSLPSPAVQNVTTWRILRCCEIYCQVVTEGNARYQDQDLRPDALDIQDQDQGDLAAKPYRCSDQQTAPFKAEAMPPANIAVLIKRQHQNAWW